MSRCGIGRRAVVALGVTALALTGLLIVPAAAAQEPPPWYTPPGGDFYAGYHISPINPPLVSREFGTYGPVTLTRVTNAPMDAFQWDTRDTNGNLIVGDDETEFAWPSTWSGGGVEMTRADPFEACPRAATSCQYFVTSGNTQDFFFDGNGT